MITLRPDRQAHERGGERQRSKNSKLFAARVGQPQDMQRINVGLEALKLRAGAFEDRVDLRPRAPAIRSAISIAFSELTASRAISSLRSAAARRRFASSIAERRFSVSRLIVVVSGIWPRRAPCAPLRRPCWRRTRHAAAKSARRSPATMRPRVSVLVARPLHALPRYSFSLHSFNGRFNVRRGNQFRCSENLRKFTGFQPRP